MAQDQRKGPIAGMARSAPSGDLEYDEAHDGLAGAAASQSVPPRAASHHAPVQVATETDDVGGDYAYDLAHDVPRGSGPSDSGTR